jgi:WXG100 family type VII secretion target
MMKMASHLGRSRGEMKVSLETLDGAARQFSTSGLKIGQVAEELDQVMKNLEEDWSDSSQERFVIFYQALKQQLLVCVELANGVSKELLDIVERYEKADSKLSD